MTVHIDQAAIDRTIEEEIRPALARIEASRKASLLLVRMVAAGMFGGFGIIALILWGLITIWLAVGVLAVGAFATGAVVWAMVRLYRGVARSVLVPPLAAAIGGMSYNRTAEGFNAAGVLGLGLLPRADVVQAEDMLVGTHRGVGFRLVEMSCYRMAGSGRNRRRQRVWRGLVVEVDVPVPFRGPVLLVRDRRASRGPEGLRQVAFPHAGFSEIFAVHAADPDEARRLITPALADSLVALSRARPGRALGAAFAEGVFLLTVPLPRGFLEQGSLFHPADRLIERVPAIVRELTLPHRVIDYLVGDRPGPLL